MTCNIPSVDVERPSNTIDNQSNNV